MLYVDATTVLQASLCCCYVWVDIAVVYNKQAAPISWVAVHVLSALHFNGILKYTQSNLEGLWPLVGSIRKNARIVRAYEETAGWLDEHTKGIPLSESLHATQHTHNLLLCG